jgi:hypothetical protein
MINDESKYTPVVKTGEAELRALQNLHANIKNSILPIIELTRSRSTKDMDRGDINKKVAKLYEAYGPRPFIVDLTGIKELQNAQIEKLLLSTSGYDNWVKFVEELKSLFPDIVPTILNSDDIDNLNELDKRLLLQVKKLDRKFDKIVYRCPIEDTSFAYDLDIIAKGMDLAEKLIFVVDAEFIRQKKASEFADRAIQIVNAIQSYKINTVVLAATSFPSNPTEFGNDDSGELNLEEITFFDLVKTNFKTSNLNLVYGDYASINPVRNDQKGGRGWIPRIDFPTKTDLFYYRKRKEKNREDGYSDAYEKVARLLIRDPKYKSIRSLLKSCWGIEQIESAADGMPLGLSPSYWISVRMNIYITLRLLSIR